MEIVGLPNDALLTNIGSLSRRLDYKDWLVTVNYIKNRNENDWKGIKFSNAPALCRGRMYSNDFDGSKKGPIFEFTIDDLESWSDVEYFYAKYFESPASVALSSVSARNISVICRIPKFELARVLFFYNTYLATSALQERALDLSFKTRFTDENHIVEVLPHCPLTSRDFKDDVLRSHLGWLLLNDKVRKSYDGIHWHLMQETIHNTDYENWIFNFTPPPLKNIKIKARFYSDSNGIYRVDEILTIENLTSDINAKVYFTGDDFIDNSVSTNTNIKITSKPKSKGHSHIVDDTSEADIDNSKQIILMPQVELHFHDPIRASIDYKKTNKQTVPEKLNGDNGEDKKKTTVVATDEATIVGNTAKGDFQNIRDSSDQSMNNAKDFKGIIKLLNDFDNKHHIELSLKYHKLPKVSGFSRHRTKTGLSRIMIEARFKYANQNFSIFEIYTADIKTCLSTLIVKADSYNQLESKISEFMTNIVEGSLTWKKAALMGNCKTLRHPVGFYEKELSESMLQKWLSGLEDKLISFQSINSD